MRIVYKYLSPARLSYFSDGLLRFTQPNALNDVFECIPAITDGALRNIAFETFEAAPESKYHHLLANLPRDERRVRIRTLSKELKKFERETLRDTDKYREKFIEEIIEASKVASIFSVSRRWNSSLMWAHYAESHTGFCVGFNAEHPFFSTKSSLVDNFLELGPVSYLPERHTVSSTKMDREGMIANLTTKSEDWRYEQEERMVIHIEGAAKTIINPNGQPPIHLFNVPHDAVVEVVVGVKSNENTIREILSFATTRNIPTYKTKMSHSGYDLSRSELN
jgi:hypothetical protein